MYHSYDELIIDNRVPRWLVPLLEWLKQLKNFLVNNTQKLVFFFCIITSLVSCKKEKLDNVENIPGLGGDTWAPTSIDNWVYDNLTESEQNAGSAQRRKDHPGFKRHEESVDRYLYRREGFAVHEEIYSKILCAGG